MTELAFLEKFTGMTHKCFTLDNALFCSEVSPW